MAEKRYFAIKNFGAYQHYKKNFADGSAPAWIKFYRSLLTDLEFSQLPDVSKGHLVLIWLLASQMNNRVPFNPIYVGRLIGANEKVDLELLLAEGWIEIVSTDLKPALNNNQDNPKPTLELDSKSHSNLISSDLISSDLDSNNTKKEDLTNLETPPETIPPPKPETPLPGDFNLTEERAYYAFKAGIADPPQEFSRFEAHVKSKDLRRCDWDAAWQEWIQSAVGYKRASFPPPRPSVATFPTDNPVELARRRCEAEQREQLREQIAPLMQRAREVFKTGPEART